MTKIIRYILVLFISLSTFSQSKEETTVINLSENIFKWEVTRQIDSLDAVFHNKLLVWGSSGDAVTKTEFLQRLNNPSFVHEKVSVEKSVVFVVNNTAILNGDGIFDLGISGNKVTVYLSYKEVFINA